MRVAIPLLGVLLLAGVVYTLSLLFAESVYTRRGSYAYWICISRPIREVPEIGNVQDVSFYSSAGDGPKPPEKAVSYTTDAPREKVLRELAQYFTSHGIPVDLGDAPSTSRPEGSKGRDSTVRALVKQSGDGRTEVTVSETF